MFRFSINVEFGRVSEPGEPEVLPGEGGPGGAQVEDAGYGSRPAEWHGTGFSLPHVEDPGPEGPY